MPKCSGSPRWPKRRDAASRTQNKAERVWTPGEGAQDEHEPKTQRRAHPTNQAAQTRPDMWELHLTVCRYEAVKDLMWRASRRHRAGPSGRIETQPESARPLCGLAVGPCPETTPGKIVYCVNRGRIEPEKLLTLDGLNRGERRAWAGEPGAYGWTLEWHGGDRRPHWRSWKGRRCPATDASDSRHGTGGVPRDRRRAMYRCLATSIRDAAPEQLPRLAVLERSPDF